MTFVKHNYLSHNKIFLYLIIHAPHAHARQRLSFEKTEIP